MSTEAHNSLSVRSRRQFIREWQSGLPDAAQVIHTAALELLDKPRDPALQNKLRAVIDEVQLHLKNWPSTCTQLLNAELETHKRRNSGQAQSLGIVDNDIIEGEILVSRLSMAMVEKSDQEIRDLITRVRGISPQADAPLPDNDLLQPPYLSSLLFKAWRQVGLSIEAWRSLQTIIQNEIATLAQECYHEGNDFLMELGIQPTLTLRPINKRPRQNAPVTEISDPETEATGFKKWLKASTQTDAVLGKFNQLLNRHLPKLMQRELNADGQVPSSPELSDAMNLEGNRFKDRFGEFEKAVQQDSGLLLQDLNERKAVLKQGANSDEERAIIEIVALLFQSILTEDRLPAAVRVWFARLQIPVLRLAVTEPQFFGSSDHPARRLIDRMGSCVMGFDHVEPSKMLSKVEAEIKRIVEYIEAYPDSGQKVFITSLHDFEAFLTQFFSHGDERMRQSVSVVQQIEQRETLAVQFTIELRKMLTDVPVHEEVRNFLFSVWAEILASSTVKHSLMSEQVRAHKRTASELIWAASAKVTRQERAQVIERLPNILRGLKEGMQSIQLTALEIDQWIAALKLSLSQAFTAKETNISAEKLQGLMTKLDALERELPDVEDFEIDDSFVFELSGGDMQNVTVINHGGIDNPSKNSRELIKQFHMGDWYKLHYNNNDERVQLIWQGMNRLLSLFASQDGRCFLMQRPRDAAYLEADLLVPYATETLTAKATRKAFAKLEADPERLVD